MQNFNCGLHWVTDNNDEEVEEQVNIIRRLLILLGKWWEIGKALEKFKLIHYRKGDKSWKVEQRKNIFNGWF